MRLRSRDLFQTVHTEGGLLPADLLQRVADGDPGLEGLKPPHYHLDPGERLGERITRAWTRLTGVWAVFDDARQHLPPGDAAGALTRDRWLQILFDELGYGRLVQQPPIQIDEKPYPVFTQWQNTPIHLVGAGVNLDRRTAGVRGAAVQSPHSLVQELLNRSPERLWGLLSNGLRLRVLRDNVTLTRQAYVEFDLEAMFTGEVYSDFVLLWLVCHQSRVEAAKPENCWLELWTHAAADSGTRALEALRQGVEAAIEQLGAGFLAQPANRDLHNQLRDGQLEPVDYYRALLRLVYRLLFLFVAEDRNALLDPAGDVIAKRRYVDHFSTAHLRDLASKRRGSRHHDRYEQLKLVMNALHEDGSEPLALPALGSYLWEPAAIGPLANAQLSNEDLFAAVRSLASVDQDSVRRAVDFRNLGAEELGSVYESLLELHPVINRDVNEFELHAASGSERKTTGSYYTPTSLISSLLDSALDPVLNEAAGAENPEQAILSLSVVDPACGSGHFLIAAANRIAKRLAAVRSDDPEPSPTETRAALRDVIGHCIHGVDINPMAVELCKVSLWMEALEPGRPLSFLDHRIVLGNSLAGTTPELIAAGIPREAFKPILGDDSSYVTALRKRNDQERAGQLTFDLGGDRLDADVRAIAMQAAALDTVDDHSLSGVREQQQRFDRLQGSAELQRSQLAADTWCAAFVALKCKDSTAITEDTLDRVLSGNESAPSVDELAVIAKMKGAYSFLHWHLAFPAAWERGGFDVVVGNPPWDQIQFREQEFFAARDSSIAAARTGSVRKRRIAELKSQNPRLFDEYENAKRLDDGLRHLLQGSGAYPLTARARMNTFALFAELMYRIVNPVGRVGAILPTGIATDESARLYFERVLVSGVLVSLFDFENGAKLFADVDSRARFSLVTLGAATKTPARFAFYLRDVAELEVGSRIIELSADDIAALNPTTKTCPVFRIRRDAEITLSIHRRLRFLAASDSRSSSWHPITKPGLFNMAADSGLFSDAHASHLAENLVPLYEGKMFTFFDHRFARVVESETATLRTGQPELISDAEHALPIPVVGAARHYVEGVEVERRLGDWKRAWILGWKEVTAATNERTFVPCLLPRVGVGHKIPIMLFDDELADLVPALAVSLSSFISDYVVRQKISGTSLTPFVIKQLPVLDVDQFRQPAPWSPSKTVSEWIRPRLLELSFTAADLAGLANDLDYEGAPFRWDRSRRAELRAELDAAMFILYGIDSEDADYVMESFPIVKRRDVEKFGEYRTKRLILERYDAMVAAETAGIPYETPVDPPPGDARAAHQLVGPTAAV